MPGHSSRHFFELTMSNNLQDILAAASGYQSGLQSQRSIVKDLKRLMIIL